MALQNVTQGRSQSIFSGIVLPAKSWHGQWCAAAVDAVIRCRVITAWRWKCLAIERLQRVRLSATLSTELFPIVQLATWTDNCTQNVALTNHATPTTQYVRSAVCRYCM